MFSSPTIGSIPRVYFIAFLGAKNGSCGKITDSLVYNDTFAASDEYSESSDYAFYSGLSPTLVSSNILCPLVFLIDSVLSWNCAAFPKYSHSFSDFDYS